VDFQSTDVAERLAIIQRLTKYKVKFLAEKVETLEEFEGAKDIGYGLFQGYYFSRPNVVKGKSISTSKVNYLKLLQEINKPDIQIAAIDQIIKRDVSLTYKLMKFINSSAFGFKSKISSIRQALTLLGLREFKKWVSVVVLGSISEGKPDALVIQSYVRAILAEDLAPKVGLGDKSSNLFLMGLFSLIDACLDRPLPEILKELPIEDEIKRALLGYPNIYRDLLYLIINYEEGNWELVSQYSLNLKINEECIPQYYLKALEAANGLLYD
jgi:EAL and modified HD-GYP domain-containing signal transduction protein